MKTSTVLLVGGAVLVAGVVIARRAGALGGADEGPVGGSAAERLAAARIASRSDPNHLREDVPVGTAHARWQAEPIRGATGGAVWRQNADGSWTKG